MAEVEEIQVHYNRKVQLDQYEPINHGATLEVSVGEDEDWREVYAEYAEDAEDEVERAIARRLTAKKLGPEADDDGD